MSIAIEPELEARLRARAEAEGITLETYLERIARDDQNAEQELAVLALEGLQSGEAVEGDEHYWQQKRRRLLERFGRTSQR